MAENLTASSASSTMHTYLLYEDNGTWKKLIDIKDYPAMGGSPETVDTTTLSQEVSTFVTGVQTLDAFEFLANFTAADFNKVKTLQDNAQVYKFALAFGKPDGTAYGSLGVFTWNGQVSTWVEGGSVNGVREMRISVSATSEVSFSQTTLTVTS